MTASGTTPAEAAEAAVAGRPALRIVRGTPTDVELAALVAVVAAAGGGDDEPAIVPVSGWRRLPAQGPGAWRLSGLVKGVRTRATW